jgi:hypothetical protein
MVMADLPFIRLGTEQVLRPHEGPPAPRNGIGRIGICSLE